MAIYNEFYYANGYYGTRASLAFSAEPVLATAINYDTVEVSWSTPTGDYSAFRVVRSQRGFPQTQEDGVIIYSSIGAPTSSSVDDTSSNATAPLVPGRFSFYRAWVKITASSDWVQAGDTFTLVPSPHVLGLGRDAAYSKTSIKSIGGTNKYVTGDAYVYANPNLTTTMSTTHDRFMGILPRVITSATNSGVDVIQDSYDRFVDPTGIAENSLLSRFMSAFSFTLDEFATFTKLIAPDNSLHYSGPAAVYLGSQELGMTQDVEPVSTTQRLLLRNAVQIYSEKGTKDGLTLFVESMTDYSATLTDTVNLMLSHEDATFDIQNWKDLYNDAVAKSTSLPAVGNWTTLSSNIALSVVSDQVLLDSTTIPRILDTTYCAKVTPSVVNQSIALGTVDPIMRGIPVTAGLPYTFSFYAKEGVTASGAHSIGVELRWYDKKGLYISSSNGTVTVTGTSWVRTSVANKVAPTGAVYVGVVITFISQNYVMYLDIIQFEQSTTATAYQEPRGVIVTLDPSKINYIKNPSFQVDTTGWSATNGSLAQVTTTAFTGTTCLSATSNGSGLLTAYASDYIPVTVGNYYSGSIYVKDVNTATNYTVSVKFYNGTTLITTAGGTITSPEIAVSTSGWTRLSISGKAPVNATQALLYIQSTTTPISGRVVYFDAAQFESTVAPTDYFDGYLVGSGSEWKNNTPSASYSGNYPARSVRLSRLKKEIESYLGFGTPYYIDTYQGQYTQGIS